MRLDAAVEAVYDAFADVERPEVVGGCACCMTAKKQGITPRSKLGNPKAVSSSTTTIKSGGEG